MADCFSGVCDWIKDILRKIGVLRDGSETSGRLLQDPRDSVRYGGIDIVQRTGEIDGIEELLGESENMELFKGILERTERRLVDVIPMIEDVIDQRELASKPEMYTNALRSTEQSGQQDPQGQVDWIESLRGAHASIRSLPAAGEVAAAEIALCSRAGEALAASVRGFAIQERAELVSPLMTIS